TGVDESVIEELALIKTLRGIVDWVDDHRDDPAVAGDGSPGAAGRGVGEHASPAASAVPAAGPKASAVAPAPVAASTPQRYVPCLVELPAAATGASEAAAGVAGLVVAVVDDSTGVADRVATRLGAAGATVVRVRADEPVPAGVHTVVDLTALAPAAGATTTAVIDQFTRLRTATQAGAARIVVVTGSGGHLGLGGTPPGADLVAVGAAAQGMVRTFARELPSVATRLVDVDVSAGADDVAERILVELVARDTPIDVGVTATGRRTVTIAARPLDVDAGLESGIGEDRDLGPGSVVVVTGGARGIGALLAIGLARSTGCGIELIGRSALPLADEPPDLAGASDAVAVRQAIIRRGELSRPAEIESATARVLADREIRGTLAALAQHAAFVAYRSLDVSDTEALATALDEIRSTRGRLDGVVHAAGVRDDKLIRDKSPASFARVFDTKVDPAITIVESVGDRGFVLLFASVSGVFGNVGQVDYAAANSALDGIARRARQAMPGSRVVAVDWGPWAGTGMVSPELAREYERRGVGLIDPVAGVDAALAELRAGAPEPQVVVMCARPDVMGA
ncbi:MAG: SDR family NAD(P)-dependent oxidoreductase, partial [Acidimicrobiales bacterium]|nr:SDR family NAD(P)-dependent oxidoreductase [Acidimicrobiales bacterium]